MSRQRLNAVEFQALAADLSTEDGTDPKEFHAKPWNSPRRTGRKAQQLCAQVKDALHVALAACADAALHAVDVVAVEPAPHTGRLRVLVASEDQLAAEVALRRATGFLRAEVAAAVCRRFTPELVFEMI